MASITGRIILYSAQGMESPGFRKANVRAWLHNRIGRQPILLDDRFLDLGAPVINHHVGFRVQESDLGCGRLILEIVAEDSGGVYVGHVRLPFKDIVHPGWVISVRPPIQSINQGSAIGVLNVAVCTDARPSPAPEAPYPNVGYIPVAPRAHFQSHVAVPVPVNYPHPSPAPEAPYPNVGYIPVAPRAHFQPGLLLVNAASHFLGGFVDEIGSQVMNQDSFGDGLNFDDWLAYIFNN